LSTLGILVCFGLGTYIYVSKQEKVVTSLGTDEVALDFSHEVVYDEDKEELVEQLKDTSNLTELERYELNEKVAEDKFFDDLFIRFSTYTPKIEFCKLAGVRLTEIDSDYKFQKAMKDYWYATDDVKNLREQFKKDYLAKHSTEISTDTVDKVKKDSDINMDVTEIDVPATDNDAVVNTKDNDAVVNTKDTGSSKITDSVQSVQSNNTATDKYTTASKSIGVGSTVITKAYTNETVSKFNIVNNNNEVKRSTYQGDVTLLTTNTGNIPCRIVYCNLDGTEILASTTDYLQQSKKVTARFNVGSNSSHLDYVMVLAIESNGEIHQIGTIKIK
jgi:hypothetical protein